MSKAHRIVINIRDSAGERETDAARRTIARWLVGITVLMVFFCAMFPFDFDFHFATAISEIHRRFGTTLEKWHLKRDLVQNLVFFWPVGFALGAWLWEWRNLSIGRIAMRCGLAIVCSAALTSAVELSQVYLISRDPALADIVSNTIGGIMGFAVFIVCGEPVMRVLAGRLIALRRIRDWRIFAGAGCVWLIIAILAPIGARNWSSLGIWNPTYPLLIGNETNGVMHWDGTISNIWLSSAGVSEDDLEGVLAAPDPGSVMRDSLVMSFHLKEEGPYVDSTAKTANLEWTANYERGATPGTTQPSDLTGVEAVGRLGVPISEGWWLSTPKGGAAKAIDQIARSEAFTLVLDLAVLDSNHGDGWPRIFSLSRDRDHCNLTVLQEHENLEVRVRTVGSSESGTNPDVIVPDVFTDTQPQRLVVSYDHGKIRVGSDRSNERYALEYSPDAWVVWRMYPRTYWQYRLDSSGQRLASALYRVLVMVPIGLLLGAGLRIVRQRPGNALRIFVAVVCAGAVVLELALHFAAGTVVWWGLPVVSVIAGGGGTWLILGGKFEGRNSKFE